MAEFGALDGIHPGHTRAARALLTPPIKTVDCDEIIHMFPGVPYPQLVLAACDLLIKLESIKDVAVEGLGTNTARLVATYCRVTPCRDPLLMTLCNSCTDGLSSATMDPDSDTDPD